MQHHNHEQQCMTSQTLERHGSPRSKPQRAVILGPTGKPWDADMTPRFDVELTKDDRKKLMHQPDLKSALMISA